jgi:hypothetical protein
MLKLRGLLSLAAGLFLAAIGLAAPAPATERAFLKFQAGFFVIRTFVGTESVLSVQKAL